MVNWILQKIIGTHHERERKRLWPVVEQINRLEPTIQPLSDDPLAHAQSGPRRHPGIPDSLAARVSSQGDPGARRDAAIEIALETIRRLSKLPGIRGFCISADGDPEAALQIIEKSGLAGD